MGELLGLTESAAWHCRLGLVRCAGETGAFLARPGNWVPLPGADLLP